MSNRYLYIDEHQAEILEEALRHAVDSNTMSVKGWTELASDESVLGSARSLVTTVDLLGRVREILDAYAEEAGA